MLTDRIQDKLRELLALPGVTAVGLGKKIIGGTQTDIIGITFGVKIKESNPENMLPTSVDIDGITYLTDVIEIGEISPAACPTPSTYDSSINGYIQSSMSLVTIDQNRPVNASGINPVRTKYLGTFGFVAYHTQLKVLVGVSAGHLLRDITLPSTPNKKVNGTNYWSTAPGITGGAAFDFPFLGEIIFSNGFNPTGDPDKPSTYAFIGYSPLQYVPLKVKDVSDPNRFNQVDAFTFPISAAEYPILPDTTGFPFEVYDGINPTFKSYTVKGIPEITTPMPFATTAELNALVSSPPSQVSSSGCGSGVKHGTTCGLKIDAVGATTSFTFSTMPGPIYFDNLIAFSRIDPADTAVLTGDSGASLIAKIGGVWKIIGLIIGGNPAVGYACRIDKIAEGLGIEAWDGSTKPLCVLVSPFGNLASSYIISSGINDSPTITQGNRVYYQGGTIIRQSSRYYG